MKYTYLLIDFFTIIIPFIFSFHPKLKFHRTWKSFFPAVILTGLVFIAWDIYFTYLGVWGFNPTYTIGIKIGNLPIEEILFFLCIPYSCVFTYHCLNLLLDLNINQKLENILSILFMILGLSVGFIFLDKIYTAVTAFGFFALIAIAKYILRVNWLSKFYFVYLILLIPFLIVNGLLTGTGLAAPVVWYNNTEIIGIRILTIPIEDVFYGMDLILLNLIIYLGMENKLKA
ncbi:lycopene cyclase domain-containing protein [Pedobacter frigiditerrae]|uniref:Lycopene cyclase domain-containing protein n=1 Tax=Pedobacter frigiditerrae TaxID=2530452 RepID=A0A4R0MR47_9SPHI|nr:lycopene cyclase domain-containing protein [Pedobacter frigiditerrae]TCC89173.1 lycopene cyclase domain-containing protein [Pedobacter frigiditerrae]